MHGIGNSKILASNRFIFLEQALRHLRQISQEVSQPNATGWGRRPAALRALSQRLSKCVCISHYIVSWSGY